MSAGPVSNAAELVEALYDSLMCRKGEVVTRELALERAKNMATYLMEIVQQANAWRAAELEAKPYPFEEREKHVASTEELDDDDGV